MINFVVVLDGCLLWFLLVGVDWFVLRCLYLAGLFDCVEFAVFG